MNITQLTEKAEQVLEDFKTQTHQPASYPRNLKGLAPFIDHTLLKPEADQKQIKQLCETALNQGFCAVCVNPVWVATAAGCLEGSNVQLAAVVGFPLGASQSASKVLEAKLAVQAGATELDMVLPIGHLKMGVYQVVLDDIQAVVNAAPKTTVKVILETGLLSQFEIAMACLLALEAGAHFVKTSTGFLGTGATIKAVQLMHCAVGGQLKIKASGGIRDLKTAQQMIMAGATRIGASQISESTSQASEKTSQASEKTSPIIESVSRIMEGLNQKNKDISQIIEGASQLIEGLSQKSKDTSQASKDTSRKSKDTGQATE